MLYHYTTVLPKLRSCLTVKVGLVSVTKYVLDEKDGQFMKVVVKDKDPGSKDDSLGTYEKF